MNTTRPRWRRSNLSPLLAQGRCRSRHPGTFGWPSLASAAPPCSPTWRPPASPQKRRQNRWVKEDGAHAGAHRAAGAHIRHQPATPAESHTCQGPVVERDDLVVDIDERHNRGEDGGPRARVKPGGAIAHLARALIALETFHFSSLSGVGSIIEGQGQFY